MKAHTVQVRQRFGKGVVINPNTRTGVTSARPSGYRGATLLCDCGNRYVVRLVLLYSTTRPTLSCGCLQHEAAAKSCRVRNQETGGWTEYNRTRVYETKHGLATHPLYLTWYNMIRRCEKPTDKHYQRYGGRGITVCPEWHDVAVFIDWIEANLGPRPEGMSLDRTDNNGPYAPGKVKWSTAKEQANNRGGRFS